KKKGNYLQQSLPVSVEGAMQLERSLILLKNQMFVLLVWNQLKHPRLQKGSQLYFTVSNVRSEERRVGKRLDVVGRRSSIEEALIVVERAKIAYYIQRL